MFYKNLLINPSATIKEALKQLSKSGEKCLIVVDKKKDSVTMSSESLQIRMPGDKNRLFHLRQLYWMVNQIRKQPPNAYLFLKRAYWY